ncbi:hypothetical protein PHYSODRAFT_285569 [Phytophthora sojae]|uniref:RxLR effector protein n=2 Tax=Phytophthora sojae TaxID=67593 RepID=G4ZA41_PHYSP|nr:hypothetical protein PHYSODRAFT_285569 [Phytophthora sojae]AEK81353.1 Avh449 [Phytophthora sojae]AEK81354.1 Avh449 [Phytophthora sojae]AEK81355.1 Avh449 [Phytophthora sojae]EGZ21180.1 hypothetical protein PHYSODRAFT_285569 [Phytophthora sojae]|eukprot:XP_009523897.1 hypothetical protein PHYSODRAFT_285569 [Phytophthora sojae]
MKAAFLTLFVVFIFVAGAEPRVGQDTLVKPPRSPDGDKATLRLLRSDEEVTDEVITGDDEERVNVPGLSAILDKISSTTKHLANKFKPAN